MSKWPVDVSYLKIPAASLGAPKLQRQPTIDVLSSGRNEGWARSTETLERRVRRTFVVSIKMFYVSQSNY